MKKPEYNRDRRFNYIVSATEAYSLSFFIYLAALDEVYNY